MVSVYMLTYNHIDFIEKAIQGVVNQRVNFIYELIISDDCSTDGTSDVVRKYAEKYPEIIVAIIRDQNVGLSQNYRETINALRGKYVAICEGDDWWIDENKLQMQADFLENNLDYVMVHTEYEANVNGEYIARYNHEKFKISEFEQGKKLAEEIFYFEIHPKTCTVCFRKVIFDKIRNDCSLVFDNAGMVSLDYPLWIEMAMHGKVKYVDKVTTHYNHHTGSISNFNNYDRRINLEKNFLDLSYYYYKKYGLEIRKSYFNRFNILLHYACKNGEREIAGKIIKYSPKTVKNLILYLGACIPPLGKLIKVLVKNEQDIYNQAL